MTQALHLNLCIPPDWKRIELVRKAVGFCVWAAFGRGDLRDSVAMVSAELLENAVKYSSDGGTQLSITVDHSGPESVVTIRLSNRASPENIKAINLIFEEMKSQPDPFEHYQMAMERSAKQTEGSGLGLIRVRAEGEMTMSHTVNDDIVCILAQTHVGRSA